MRPYVVQQGDHLARIAYRFGVNPEAIWSHPDNASIAARRKRNLLLPGDVLQVPDAVGEWHELDEGATNVFRARVPKLPVRVTFRSNDGPIANEAYELTGLGKPLSGSTDGDGALHLEVPVHLREITVRFPRLFTTYVLHVGDMDPIDEPSGIRGRLKNLGFYRHFPAAPGEDTDAQDRTCIAAFQEAVGLEPTGEADAATLAELPTGTTYAKGS